MQIAIMATNNQKKEVLQKSVVESVIIKWIPPDENLPDDADACVDLTFNDVNVRANKFLDKVTVFANALNCNCAEIGHANYVRLNAWHGFLNRPLIEIASNDNTYRLKASKILDAIGWKYTWVADYYGLVSARII